MTPGSGSAPTAPRPRTLLAWQRTNLGVAGVAVLIALALTGRGETGWALVVLGIAVIPVPAAVRRERQLLAARPVAPGRLAPATLVVAVTLFAVAGAAMVLAG